MTEPAGDMPKALSFFDCNMRVGRASVVRPEHILDVSGLLAEMDYLGITRALVYHAFAVEWDAPSGNQQLLEEIQGCERLFPCFVMLPHATAEMPPPKALAEQIKQWHGAARVYPKAHQYVLSDWCLGPTLKALADFQIPLLVELAQIEWNELAHILHTYPSLPVILLATSYRINRYIYPLWEKHENLYLEIATYQIMRGLEDVCRRFGPERLVFGTGLPLLDGGGPVAQITYAELPWESKQLIAGANLARLLGVSGE